MKTKHIALFAVILFFLTRFLCLQQSIAQQTTPHDILVSYRTAQTDSAELESLRQILNYWRTYKTDSTIFYSKLLINKALSCNEVSKAYKGYYWLCNTYIENGHIDSALVYAFEGLDVFSGAEQLYPKTVMLLLIGEQFRAMQQFDDAQKYLFQSWNAALNTDRKEVTVGIANRIAAVYHESKDHENALLWADSSLKLEKLYDNYSYHIKNLAIKAAVYRDQKLFQKALDILHQALEAAKGNEVLEIELMNNLASTYYQFGKTQPAVEYAELSYSKSVQMQLDAYCVVSAEILATAYSKLGNFKKAFHFMSAYEQIRHRVFYRERDAQIAELNTRYEIQKKETEIEQQKLRLVENEWAMKRKNIILISVLVLFLILVFFSVYLFAARRKIKSAHNELLAKNMEIEQQKQEIENKAVEIQKAYNKLKELDIQKQSFIHMLVHDLKNPLNLLVNVDLFEDEKERAELVKNSANQMLTMVMNMLDVSSSEEKEMKLYKEKFVLDQLLKKAIDEQDFLRIPKSIIIDLQTDNTYTVFADKNIFHRMMVNLLSNALKFSYSSDVVQVLVRRKSTSALYVSVKDNGPGIKKEDHQRLFKKFSQLDQPKESHMGSTGLGLAFCKIAAEAHGWNIGVRSSEGKGAEFWIELNDFDTTVS